MRQYQAILYMLTGVFRGGEEQKKNYEEMKVKKSSKFDKKCAPTYS